MIRHRPHGSGHPYATTGDQRVPAEPEAGERCELRARASASVRSMRCEWAAGDQPIHEWPMRPPGGDAVGDAAADGGHLAAAQARSLADQQYWHVTTPPLTAGTTYRYRFIADYDDQRTRSTRWYDVTAAEWRDDGGTLIVDRTAAASSTDVDGTARWLVGSDGPRRVRFDLPLAPGDRVVGFGERYDHVDQRGRLLDAVVFEQYKQQGAHGRTYLPMPFAMVVGERTWGFHVRTSRRTWYDVGASRPDTLTVEAETGGDDELVVRIYDGSPTEILNTFLDDAGRPELLPDWVFRLWASGNEWNTQARVMAEMEHHRTHDIPVGALVIEAWSDESTFTAFRDAEYDVNEDGSPHRLSDFRFPPAGAWPDPKGMVDELHDRDIKVLLWQIPLLKMRPHPTGQLAADARAAVEQGLVVTEADGRPYRNRGWWFPLALMPDLASQQARTWWTEKRRYLVEELGIDGFKTDGGEHAWGHDLQHGVSSADGPQDGAAANNLFPVHYARAYGDLLRSCGKAPVTFSRAGFTGSQAHGAFWAGDEDSTWDGLRSAVTAGITASACGIVYWGWDLAGFSGDVPDAELYLRATAASCFMPIMQYHSEFNHHRRPWRDRTPWNVAEQTGDERVIPVFRRYAHLRDRLVPYLAEQAAHTVAGGAPLMRGLFFDYPGDDDAWVYPRQYLLGDDLLVAPVVDPGVTSWDTYLPGGEWVDAWTGQELSGGSVVTREVPIDEVPVYCRSASWPRLRHVFSP
ncbi:TIM-barrel domain-containing protein [Phytoactinopolyspora limicola]|uniref:TIM-barrel domain-containing protein n=1 Tax=Phytoactinopolyspora limicola TaxID=2715536 RepID=UPI001409B151|nr:TIM-barrel domain-containing protein [Phytoactinopolyspora limicola]